MNAKNNYYNNAKDNFKIWIDDGIIKISTGKGKWTIETMARCMEEFNELNKKLPKNQKVLIDVSLTPSTPTAAFRKEMISIIAKTFRSSRVKKVAIWGGSTLVKVVISFFITAIRIKNIQHFKAEEEALKWLKED